MLESIFFECYSANLKNPLNLTIVEESLCSYQKCLKFLEGTWTLNKMRGVVAQKQFLFDRSAFKFSYTCNFTQIQF